MAKRKKIIYGFCIFLGVMLFFTFLSRAYYVSGLPRVSTVRAEEGRIIHTVETEGTVKGSREYGISTISGLLVKTVEVDEGDVVEAGTILFYVDLEDLKRQIREKELTIEKLALQTRSMEENETLTGIKNQTNLQRAKEDYVRNGTEAMEASEKAKKELEKAKEALLEHQTQEVEVTSESKREEEEKEYSEWVKKGQRLSKEISDLDEKIKEAEEALQGENGSEEELETLKQRKKEAEKEYQSYNEESRTAPDYTEEDAKKELWKQKEKELEKAVEDAQEAYKAALLQEEKILLDGTRKIEDAHAAAVSDASVEINLLDIAYQQELLEEYRRLLGQEGCIYAEKEAVISEIRIRAGSRTGTEASVLCTDLESPLYFEAVIGKEQRKYVEKGDQVKIKLGKIPVDAEIESIIEAETIPGSYFIRCRLPEEKGTIGEGGTLQAAASSENYALRVQVSVVHTDLSGQNFVYLLQETDTILGRELSARKVTVTVLEQNDTYAALESGTVNQDSLFIVDADKEFTNGDIVRPAE